METNPIPRPPVGTDTQIATATQTGTHAQPLAQNPAPLGPYIITFIEPPPLPSFMQEEQSSGLAGFGLSLLNTFMGPTISMGGDLSRAANNVLTALGAPPELPVIELIHALPKRSLCELFCGGQAPVRITKDSSGLFICTVARPDAKLPDVPVIALQLADAKMVQQGAALLLGVALSQAKNTPALVELLEALAKLLTAHPNAQFPTQSLLSLKQLVKTLATENLVSADCLQPLLEAVHRGESQQLAVTMEMWQTKIESQLRKLPADASRREDMLHDLCNQLQGLLEEALDKGESAGVQYALDKLAEIRDRYGYVSAQEILSACHTHLELEKTPQDLEIAYKQAAGQIPQTLVKRGGGVVIADEDQGKVIDPNILLDYLRVAVKVPGSLHPDALVAYIEFGRQQGGHLFTPAAVRNLWLEYVRRTPGNAAFALTQWLGTVNGENGKPDFVEAAELASALIHSVDDRRSAEQLLNQLLETLQNLDPRLAAKVVSVTDAQMMDCSGFDAEQLKAALGSESLIQTGERTQGHLLAALLRLDNQELPPLAAAFAQRFTPTAPTAGPGDPPLSAFLLGGISLLAQGASTPTAILKVLAEAAKGAEPAPHLTEQLCLELITRLLTHIPALQGDDMRRLAAVLVDQLIVPQAGEEFHDCAMRLFTSVAATPEGLQALRMLLPVLRQQHAAISGLEPRSAKRNRMAATVGACTAALSTSTNDNSVIPKYSQGVVELVEHSYHFLCLYTRSMNNGNVRLAAKYLWEAETRMNNNEALYNQDAIPAALDRLVYELTQRIEGVHGYEAPVSLFRQDHSEQNN